MDVQNENEASLGYFPASFKDFYDFYQMFKGMGFKPIKIKGDLTIAMWEEELLSSKYPQYYFKEENYE